MRVYDLSRGALDALDGQARYATHPAVTDLRYQLEEPWLADLELLEPEVTDVPAALTALAAARPSRASGPTAPEDPATRRAEVVELLSRELVLSADLELLPARLEEVLGRHVPRVPGERLRDVLAVVDLPDHARTTTELEISALAGLLALSHWLAPEALGAVALHHLLREARLEDTRHMLEVLGSKPALAALDQSASGVLSDVVAPVLAERPQWCTRVHRGALWYAALDSDLHDALGSTRA